MQNVLHQMHICIFFSLTTYYREQVRSAAVKCLDAVIRSRSEMLQQLYVNVMPALLGRFREREEIVKMDVFTAFKDLLRQSQSQSHGEDLMEVGAVCVYVCVCVCVSVPCLRMSLSRLHG